VKDLLHELSYRKQIARQLRTQYVEGIYDNPLTLKSRLTVTQGHWKRNHWVDHIRLTISRVIKHWILSWPWNVGHRSLKVIEISAFRKHGCGFLFAFHSNYGRICNRLWDTGKGKGKGLDTCYSATYTSQTRDQQRFTISEVAADWHEPMVLQRIMWPSIAGANEQLDPRCS